MAASGASEQTPATAGVYAVVVTFHPDQGLADRLQHVAEQVTGGLVIDNGSSPDALALVENAARGAGFALHANPRNLGIAAALNQGLSAAREAGSGFALLLDQDSVPAAGMVARLVEEFRRLPGVPVALIGPTVVDEARPERSDKWLRPHPSLPWLPRHGVLSEPAEVTFAITSGTLLSLNAFALIGPFREDLFIDFVDIEFCLRAQERGFRVRACPPAVLRHRRGDRRPTRILGRTFHPPRYGPNRLYYQYRNLLLVLRAHGRGFPHWALFTLASGAWNLVRTVLLEPTRREKLAAALTGLADGLAGRAGPRREAEGD